MRVQITAKNGYRSRYGDEYPRGTVADIPDRLAVKLLNRGVAIPAPEPEIETAAVEAPENTAKRVGRAPKKRIRKGGDE